MAAHFTVVRTFGIRKLSDEQVFFKLEKQFVVTGCRMKISFRATEEQIDKAMHVLMQRVAKHEILEAKKQKKKPA